MKPFGHLLIITFAIVFFSSCQKEYSFENNSRLDPDTQKFIDSSGIRDTTLINSVNTFVLQLKTTSLWTKFMAIYPLLGGTEQTMKWNLKDPRNVDAAYRLTIHGNPVYSTSGMLFPGNGDYADTHLYDSLLTYNDNSISYFSETQNKTDGYDMGCIDNAAPYNELAIYHSTDASNWFGYYAWGFTPSKTTGLFMLSATVADVKRYEDAVITSAKGSQPVYGFSNKPILIGTVEAASCGGHRECGLATIGQGLSDQEALSFYKIVQEFETRLGR